MLTRRKFLQNTGGALALVASPVLLQSCAAGIATYRGEFDGEKIIIPKSEATTLRQPNGIMMVRAENLPIPIVVRNVTDKGLLAISTVCAHAGCEVRVLPHAFECPCHGSAYDEIGEVTEGPASRPLQRFNLEETEENIIIQVKS